MKKYIDRITEILKTSEILPSPQQVLKKLFDEYIVDGNKWYHNFHHSKACQSMIASLSANTDAPTLEIIPAVLNDLPPHYINKDGDFAQLLSAFLSFYPHYQAKLEPALLECIGSKQPYLFSPDHATKNFLKQIHATDINLIRYACEGLGQLHRSIPKKQLTIVFDELIKLLASPSPSLKHAACDALLKLTDRMPASTVDTMYSTLRAQTKSDLTQTRIFAYDALTSFAMKLPLKQKSELYHAVAQEEHWSAPTTILTFISRLAPFEENTELDIVKRLTFQLKNSDDTIRNIAVEALTALMPKISAAGLNFISAENIKLLNKDVLHCVRRTAIDLYCRIGVRYAPNVRTTFINQFLYSPSEFIYQCIIDYDVAALIPTEKIPDLLEKVKREPNFDALIIDTLCVLKLGNLLDKASSLETTIHKLYTQFNNNTQSSIKIKACRALALFSESMSLLEKDILLESLIAKLHNANNEVTISACTAIGLVVINLEDEIIAPSRAEKLALTAIKSIISLLEKNDVDFNLKKVALETLATLAIHIPAKLQSKIAGLLLNFIGEIWPATDPTKKALVHASIIASYDLMNFIPTDQLIKLSKLLQSALDHSAEDLHQDVIRALFKLIPRLPAAELHQVSRSLIASFRRNDTLLITALSNTLITATSPISTAIKQDYLLPLLIMEHKNAYISPINYLGIATVLEFFQTKILTQLRYLHDYAIKINSAVVAGLSALRPS